MFPNYTKKFKINDSHSKCMCETCAPLKIKTRALPAAVSPHVNIVPIAACKIGDTPSIIFGRLQVAANKKYVMLTIQCSLRNR